jgi:hypothetical protein
MILTKGEVISTKVQMIRTRVQTLSTEVQMIRAKVGKVSTQDKTSPTLADEVSITLKTVFSTYFLLDRKHLPYIS